MGTAYSPMAPLTNRRPDDIEGVGAFVMMVRGLAGPQDGSARSRSSAGFSTPTGHCYNPLVPVCRKPMGSLQYLAADGLQGRSIGGWSSERVGPVTDFLPSFPLAVILLGTPPPNLPQSRDRGTIPPKHPQGENPMDVGFQMAFTSYGWTNISDTQVWDEEIALARLAADSRLRRPVVGRAPLQRLLLLPRQPATDVLPGRSLPQHRPRHRRRHPALARPAASRRARHRGRSPQQGPPPPRHGPRPRSAGVPRLPRHHGRIPRTLRRSRRDDRQRPAHRLHRGRRQVLQTTPHRTAPAALQADRRPHLRRGLLRRTRSSPPRNSTPGW